jgi:uncharacterized integral membrane protein
MSESEALEPSAAGMGESEPSQGESEGGALERREPLDSPDAPLAQPSSTRVSRVWIGSSIGLLILIAILVFILQNLASVAIHFPGATVRLPAGIAILFGVILGGLLVFVLGLGRVLQLRRQIIQHRHAHRSE